MIEFFGNVSRPKGLILTVTVVEFDTKFSINFYRRPLPHPPVTWYRKNSFPQDDFVNERMGRKWAAQPYVLGKAIVFRAGVQWQEH